MAGEGLLKQHLSCIQGECTGPVPDLMAADDVLNPDLWPLQTGQCLIYTNKVLMNFFGISHEVRSSSKQHTVCLEPVESLSLIHISEPTRPY